MFSYNNYIMVPVPSLYSTSSSNNKALSVSYYYGPTKQGRYTGYIGSMPFRFTRNIGCSSYVELPSAL